MDFLNKVIDLNLKFSIKMKIIAPIVLLVISSLIILKTSNIEKSYLFESQLKWALLGAILFFMIFYVKIDFLYKNSNLFYLFIIILFIATMFFGFEINNSQRWISFGFFSFQPSEIGKLFFVLFVARYLSDRPKSKYGFHTILLLFLPTFITFILILQQPDLGTSLVYLFIIFPMMYWAGIKPLDILLSISPFVSFLIAFTYEFSLSSELVKLNETYFFILFFIWIISISIILVFKYRFRLNNYVIALIITANLLITTFTKIFLDKLMLSYWFKRIIAFLDPFTYRNDFAYQINSSYDAIGSGGFFGKGLGRGMLTEFKMMPIYESDFIVSALAEQIGFVGILALIICLFYFFYWFITYLEKSINKFEQLILIGFGSIWFFHSFVNLCIVSGIFPVTGLPFPFLSYGGTSLMANCIMLSIANRVISKHISN